MPQLKRPQSTIGLALSVLAVVLVAVLVQYGQRLGNVGRACSRRAWVMSAD